MLNEKQVMSIRKEFLDNLMVGIDYGTLRPTKEKIQEQAFIAKLSYKKYLQGYAEALNTTVEKLEIDLDKYNLSEHFMKHWFRFNEPKEIYRYVKSEYKKVD